MKINIHRADERGKSEIGWLSSRFSFSFADYSNLDRTGFGKLLVLNDDTIMPAKGFGAHQHENMEIITLVMYGELEHKDSLGSIEVLKKGEMQVMSAGRGITHSEYNHSKTNHLELFQLWIETARLEITPRHETRQIKFKDNELIKVVSGTQKDNVLFINQDSKIFLGKFSEKKKINYSFEKNRGLFVFVIEGEVEVEGTKLRESGYLVPLNEEMVLLKKGFKYDIIGISEKNKEVLLIEAKYCDLPPSAFSGKNLLNIKLHDSNPDSGEIAMAKEHKERLKEFESHLNTAESKLCIQLNDYNIRPLIITKFSPLTKIINDISLLSFNEFLN